MYRPKRFSGDNPPRRPRSNHENFSRVADAAGLVSQGMSRAEASELAGIDVTDRELPTHHPFVPTPAMIEAECAKIRDGLSEKELRSRCMVPQTVRWRLPDVSTSDLVA